MELILWRHADAEEGSPDSARKLTPKGEKQAANVAKWLRARLPESVRILSSPAQRARQTAQALSEAYTVMAELDVGVSAASVLDAAGWPAAKGTVIVVGHQPTFGQAAALALTGNEADWGIKKGALWWFVTKGPPDAPEVLLRAVIGPDLV
jgi:phosphohistidine phosphatase